MAINFADNLDVDPMSARHSKGRASLSAIHLIGAGALLLIVLLALAY